MRRTILALVAAGFLLTGCVTAGKDFPAEPVRKIVNGETTRAQILQTFGRPTQKGIENGKETWTYYRIKYRGPRKAFSKELHIVFDEKGNVDSYSFSETTGNP